MKGMNFMEGQITLNNFLPLDHLIELGKDPNLSFYKMDEDNPKDVSFFDNLREIGIEYGATMIFRRGELNVKLRCIRIEGQDCYWRKIR
jgi:hypothetical protein